MITNHCFIDIVYVVGVKITLKKILDHEENEFPLYSSWYENCFPSAYSPHSCEAHRCDDWFFLSYIWWKKYFDCLKRK